ncbi:MAG: hypothetical protein KAR38_15055 [Calditrichia bacterium]|nr:hypothetical protein [Calditrichia bacterium]
MKNCKKIKEYFIEALYDELADSKLKELNEHLKECKTCSTEYEEMKATLEIMSQKSEEKPDEKFWDEFTDNVLNNVKSEKKIFVMPRWSLQLAGAAAMIIMGIFIGRYMNITPAPEQPIVNNQVNTDTQIHQAAVTRQAAQYLEKSKIILLGIINMDTDVIQKQSMDFSHQKKISRDLIHKAAVLKKNLSGTDQLRLKTLISELELILMQISNYELEFDVPAIELIKSSVDNRGILLKINVEEMIMFNQQPEQKNRKKQEKKKENKTRI